jgi:hypothetical protein
MSDGKDSPEGSMTISTPSQHNSRPTSGVLREEKAREDKEKERERFNEGEIHMMLEDEEHIPAIEIPRVDRRGSISLNHTPDVSSIRNPHSSSPQIDRRKASFNSPYNQPVEGPASIEVQIICDMNVCIYINMYIRTYVYMYNRLLYIYIYIYI